MRTLYRRNGQRISLDAWNFIDDTNYPPGSLKVGDHDIVEAQVEDYPDSEKFTWTENLDGTLNVTPIPQDQIDAIQNERIQQQIDAEERNTMLPRVVREFMLGAMSALTPKGTDPMQLPAYAKLKALDDKIAGLRRSKK
jgi:hypothetical protein